MRIKKLIYINILLVVNSLLIAQVECSDIDLNKSYNQQTNPLVLHPYFGQSQPGLIPELFAPGQISTSLYTRDLTMMPDGSEIYFSVSALGYNLIFFTKQLNGIWTEPKPAPFIKDYDCWYYEPHITTDGKKMLFLSTLIDKDGVENDEDIWVVNRVGDSWGTPYNIGEPINRSGGDFFPSTTKDGTIYFTRQEENTRESFIYRSRLINDKYAEPEKLNQNVNCGTNRYNGYIDVEEKFIIVPAEGMKDSYGGTDYYIIFRDKYDNWSEPINMGSTINSRSGREYSASISPDGKFLFFMSSKTDLKTKNLPKDLNLEYFLKRMNSSQNGNSDIYWVSTDFIDDLRPDNFKK